MELHQESFGHKDMSEEKLAIYQLDSGKTILNSNADDGIDVTSKKITFKNGSGEHMIIDNSISKTTINGILSVGKSLGFQGIYR